MEPTQGRRARREMLVRVHREDHASMKAIHSQAVKRQRRICAKLSRFGCALRRLVERRCEYCSVGYRACLVPCYGSAYPLFERLRDLFGERGQDGPYGHHSVISNDA